MKKFLLTLSAGVICLLTSCSGKKEGGGTSETTKKNIAANEAIMKMFETGDWSKVGDYIAADGINHSGPKGDIKGLDSLKAYFAQMGQMMTNMKNDIIKMLADDEYVMCLVKGTATAKMDLPEWGMKAGQTHTSTSVEVSKYKDGKVTDHWTYMDANEMMQMMSGAPPPPMDNKMEPAKDTTSK